MKTTLEQVHDLEKKVDELSSIIKSLSKSLEDFIEHYNYHTHPVNIGDWDCYGNNSRVTETNEPSSRVDCP